MPKTESLGKWGDRAFPKRGWHHEGVSDLGEAYATCDMCGYSPIRYLHCLSHKGQDMIEVGCVCAGKLTEDVAGAEALEDALKNRAARRNNWLRREWKTSKRGNARLKLAGHWFTVFRSQYGGWSASVAVDKPNAKPKYAQGKFAAQDEAKLAIFDSVWPARVSTRKEN
jgi:hypothetical protein